MGALVLVDGGAGVGKGTLASRLAAYFGLHYIDSGLMYRAVASKVMETGSDPVLIASTLAVEDLKRSNLRSREVTNFTPSISKLPEVRSAINESLRRIISQSHGCVMDGRAGGHEFPHAEVKIFLIASAEVRAKRRLKQLHEAGVDTSYDQVLADQIERDKKDSERDTSPLAPATGAEVIDTDQLTAEQVFEKACEVCYRQMHNI